MLTRELNDFVKNECGDSIIGIAPADVLTEDEIRQAIRTNEIMSRYTPLITPDTPVVQPREFLETATAVIVVGLNFYFGRKDLPGSPPRSEIMNFYVNQDCVDYISEQSNKIISFLEQKGHEAVLAAYGTPIKTVAAKSGIGWYGKNAVIITPEFGSWVGIILIITDAPLEITSSKQSECGNCNKCRDACPTGALSVPYTCDAEKCITLHTIYNKGEIPVEIREKMGTVVGQCNICLDVCPKNKKLPLQKNISVPEHLVYPEIVPLLNMSDSFYKNAFDSSFLDYTLMDKKYMQRNAAIALGNCGDPAYIPELARALETQEEELIRTSAAWALGKIGGGDAKSALEKRRDTENSEAVKSEIDAALERISRNR